MNEAYKQFIRDIKQNILHSRYRAAKSANKEQLLLYLRIGKMLEEKRLKANWGDKVIAQVSTDLQQELPGLRGFSAGNLKKMRIFYTEWYRWLDTHILMDAQGKATHNKPLLIGSTVLNQLKDAGQIDSTALNQFEVHFFSLGFTLHYLILSKTSGTEERLFYIVKAAREFWTFRVLEKHLKDDLFHQQGQLPNNFSETLPENLSGKVLHTFRDEYLWAFIAGGDEDNEMEVEREIVQNIKKFILSLGGNFAFLGNQYRIVAEDEELFIDLLFFQRELQSLVAFELKTGKFKAEYIGKMNLYLSALDEYVKQPHENPSIGIILCKSKNDKFVEFAFRDFNKPMGVALYKTQSEIPSKYQKALPDINQLKNLM